jgi:hypothetical protein
VFGESQFAEGCHVPASRRVEEDVVCWTEASAEIRVPLTPDDPSSGFIEVKMHAETEKVVRISCGGEPTEVRVGPEASIHRVPIVGTSFDVINNVGSRLVLGGYGGDRGFLERDDGQYEEAEDVFAWCGAAVLIRASYLRMVGRLDDRYFVYYEDTDLAWRGQLAGWRHRYVPTSIVRHEHAATSREGSELFQHCVDRNRLLTLARNAPWSWLWEASRVYLVDTAAIFKRDVIGRRRAGRGVSPGLALRRLRTFFAFLKFLPSTLLSRSRQKVSATERQRIVDQWAVPM